MAVLGGMTVIVKIVVLDLTCGPRCVMLPLTVRTEVMSARTATPRGLLLTRTS